MAEIIPKNKGIYDKIDSNYLTPEPFAHNIGIRLEIEVYSITYDWGIMGMDNMGYPIEFAEPYYVGTLDGIITSANFTLDSTTDMRTTGTFSIILNENSPFITNAQNGIFFQHVWFKVIKKYDYINDLEMYPTYDWGDYIGLWNNNGLFKSDPSKSVLGWFVPNATSCTYNVETREMSVSCTDMLAFYTENRGGHLTDWWESNASPDYVFYDSVSKEDNEDNVELKELRNDIKDVAKYSTGMILEGEKNLISDMQYDNYLGEYTQRQSKTDDDKISILWEESYNQYASKIKGNPKSIISHYEVEKSDKQFTDTNSLLRRLVGDYSSIIPVAGMSVSLQNGNENLPYDIDISGDTSLYDALKKVIDLYPRQTLYFDVNRKLCMEQYALAWGEWSTANSTLYRAREFYDLVLEENWNINLEGIKNFTVLWGRDDSCMGYYYITSYQMYCPKCQKIYDYDGLGKISRYKCLHCDGTLERLHISNKTYSVQTIGTHKQVIYDDNVITEKEAFENAKWHTINNCRAGKTLTIRMMDRYLSMYQASDKAIGRRIEYKSHLTNETDVYTILKWSNDFNSGEVTMELEPYYPCIDDEYHFKGYSILPSPTFTCTVDENGLLEMIINNGEMTEYSLFKIYYKPTSWEKVDSTVQSIYDHTAMNMDFLGETCEVYAEATKTQHQTKIFRHQFTKGGRYMITCQAWNPNIRPSGCHCLQIINVDLGSYYVDENKREYISEKNENYSG